MCNLYRLEKGADAVQRAFSGQAIRLLFPEGLPNFQPRDICITDAAPIVRAAAGEAGAAELVTRRWSWPGPAGKPVYNYRSDGREFPNGRCLILTDGFYEYTAPADPKQKRKDKWRFTRPDEALFAIAGLWRNDPQVGEAFTMLTTSPGPDVAPYHHRQVAVLDRGQWARWLDRSASVRGLIGPLPAGTLRVEKAS
jgi:putative SOS response-associated peptidase YedK